MIDEHLVKELMIRRKEIKTQLEYVLGKKMILSKNWKDYKKLIGIKNYLYKQRDPDEYDPFQEKVFVPSINFPHRNHLAEINFIIDGYRNRRIKISKSDKDRFNHLSCPNLGIDYQIHDSNIISISAFDALEIFERDLHFLISPTVDEHLDGKGRIEKKRVSAAIASDRPSSLVGVGSKVTLYRYRELVRATESGWRTLLAMRGIRSRTVPQISSEILVDLCTDSAECLAA